MKNKQAKRYLLALLLAVVLLINMAVPVVHATDTVQIAFGQISGKRGEQVTVPVTIENNPGIAGMRFRIAYDATALTYISAAKGEVMTGGTLSAAYQTEDEELAITWFDVRNITGDGVLFYLVYEISETASGTYPLVVSYPPDEIINGSLQQVDISVVHGSVKVGSNLAGTLTSFGSADDAATVKLMQGDTEVASAVTTDGTYSFTSVDPGNYTLVVSKPNHVIKTYEVTVIGEDVALDVTIYLLGDITCEGKVNSDDVIRLLLHVSMPNMFPIDTEADFTCDGKVNSDDVIRLLLHVSMPGMFPLGK